MKIAVFVMAIMVMCICPGRISEEKDLVLGEERRPKDCRSPKGKPGSVRNDGCIQSTCTNGKWKPKMRMDICCYKQQAHKPNTVLDTIVSADNCSSTTIGCGAVGQLEFKHETCADPATKQQVEQLELNLEQTIENQVDDLSKKLENQAEKIDDLTKMVKDNFDLMEKLTCVSTGMGEIAVPMSPTVPPTGSESEGVLITGGVGAKTSTELFLPHTGKTCRLKSLPDSRYYHSLDVLSKKIILCGGGFLPTSCLEFLPTSSTGSWVNYTTLAQGRYWHTTHSFREDLLLGGGWASQGTTEIIGKGSQYNLQQDTSQACSIPDQSSTIITGGYDLSGRRYLKTVARYNMQGFVENLPDLATTRFGHGCGSYTDKGNTKVLVVAGGTGSVYLSSTELLTAGATAWTRGESLPRGLAIPASVNMGSDLLIIGGHSGGYFGSNRGEILKFNGTWTEVGMMQNARYGAGATKIKIDDQLDITACY